MFSTVPIGAIVGVAMGSKCGPPGMVAGGIVSACVAAYAAHKNIQRRDAGG